MAWTAPPTFSSGSVLTAAQLNVLSSDLLETSAAKATTAGRYTVSTGLNQLAERIPSVVSINTPQTTTSTTYADLATAGPTVTAVTGPNCMAFFGAKIQNNTTGSVGFMAINYNGNAPADNNGVYYTNSNATDYARVTGFHFFTTFTPGTQTLTLQYRVTAGTGTFDHRRLAVFPL